MSIGKVGGGPSRPVESSEAAEVSPEVAAALAKAQAEAEAKAGKTGKDPRAAARALSAHQADPTATALQAKLGQADAAAADIPPDFYSMEEFYAGMPPEVRTMDQQISKADTAFRSGPMKGVESPETKLIAFMDRGQKMIETMLKLAVELQREPVDVQNLTQAAGAADQAFLDFASNGDPRAREVMARNHGQAVNGGGLFGNDVAGALERAKTERPQVRGQGTQPTGGTQATGGTKGAESGKTGPAGYDLHDGARSGQYVKAGSRGDEANALINALNAAGHEPKLDADGKIDADDDAAIKKFQQENNLIVDGLVGPQTMGALDKKLGLTVKSQLGGWLDGFGPDAAGGPGGAGAAPPAGSTEGAPARQAAVNAARSQVGVREATRNNDGLPAQRYANGRAEPWCADFVSWSFRQAGNPLPGNQQAIASCRAMQNELKKSGDYFGKSQPPAAGDVVFFGSPPRHVGIVSRVENGKVHTIEGNSGDRVAERSYSTGDSKISGFARPR